MSLIRLRPVVVRLRCVRSATLRPQRRQCAASLLSASPLSCARALLSSPSCCSLSSSSFFSSFSSSSSPAPPSAPSAASAPSPSTSPSPVVSYVVTTAGPDRPGIVHAIASHVHSLGCNIEESRMTCLGSDFAVLLRLSAPASLSCEELTTSLQRLFPAFLVQARATSAVPPVPPPCHILSVSIEGPDQPGVVKAFTAVFSRVGAAVRDLDTDTSSAPFAGYRVFSLRCVVAVPVADGAMERVRKGLDDFEAQWGFDVVVDDEDGGEHAEGEGEAEAEAADDDGANVEEPHWRNAEKAGASRGRRQ